MLCRGVRFFLLEVAANQLGGEDHAEGYGEADEEHFFVPIVGGLHAAGGGGGADEREACVGRDEEYGVQDQIADAHDEGVAAVVGFLWVLAEVEGQGGDRDGETYGQEADSRDGGVVDLPRGVVEGVIGHHAPDRAEDGGGDLPKGEGKTAAVGDGYGRGRLVSLPRFTQQSHNGGVEAKDGQHTEHADDQRHDGVAFG